MIVKMQKVTVVALTKERDDVLNTLQTLGLLHVKQIERPVSAKGSEVQDQIKRLYSASVVLSEHQQPAPNGIDAQDPALMLDQIHALNDQYQNLKERLAVQLALRDDLAVWGNFEPAKIAELETQGIFVALYKCPYELIPEVNDDLVIQIIDQNKYAVSFAVVGSYKQEFDIPEVSLPACSLEQLDQQIVLLKQELQAKSDQIAQYACHLPLLNSYQLRLDEDFDRASAHDNSAKIGIFTYLQGFAPKDEIVVIEEAALNNGWGIIVEEPSDGELVPTLIRNPAWIRPIESVFDFIDTFPGYKERDVSFIFYLAFSLFYAMLIGDAGYGFVFLLGTIGLQLWKGKSIPKGPIYLMYVLNIATIIWGVLTGAYFGINISQIALLNKWVVLDSADLPTMLKFCFTVAVFHLAFAHLWSAFRIMNSLKALSQIGWAMTVVGAYFLVRMLLLNDPYPMPMAYMAGLGLILVVCFSGFFKNPEAVISLPNTLISCFSDIISYMRLFAVSFAALKLAEAFNGMAADIGMSSILAGFGAALILLVGHSLNMAMGLLSVLVHGLRLNMLEFSGHLEMEWAGFKYNPLKRKNKN